MFGLHAKPSLCRLPCWIVPIRLWLGRQCCRSSPSHRWWNVQYQHTRVFGLDWSIGLEAGCSVGFHALDCHPRSSHWPTMEVGNHLGTHIRVLRSLRHHPRSRSRIREFCSPLLWVCVGGHHLPLFVMSHAICHVSHSRLICLSSRFSILYNGCRRGAVYWAGPGCVLGVRGAVDVLCCLSCSRCNFRANWSRL